MPKMSGSGNAGAILWVLLGTALFSIVYASAKFGDGIASPLQVVLLRYISGFVVLCGAAVYLKDGLAAHFSKKPFAHFARAVFGCYGGAAIIYSSAKMPILDATAISLLYVIFIVALGVVILNERVGKLHWMAIVLSSLGALTVMMSRGAFQSFNADYLWPAFIAMAGALLIAMEAILIRTLSQSDKTLTVLLYVNFFGILLVAIPALSTWQMVSLSETMLLCMLGPIAISAQYCIIQGYRIADVSVVGPVDYTWLIFAALIGLVFFGEIPTPGVILGAALIVFGGYLLSVAK